MSKMNKIIYFILAIILFLTFDVYLSSLILNSYRFNFPQNEILDLVYVQNTGAAFSLLENSQIFLILFSIIALVFVVVYVIKNISKYHLIYCFWFAMLVSGIACNLYERLAYGYVRDFFKLNFINFPIFNISDIFINISVIALVVLIVKKKLF